VLSRCGNCFVVVLLVLTMGLHWTALQTVAWATMLTANLSCENFSTAVSNTFDGKHPCCLCKAIAAGKKSEKKQELTPGKTKLEYLPLERSCCLFTPAYFCLAALNDFSAKAVFSKPLLQPPRKFIA